MTNKAKKLPNAGIGPNAEALGLEKAREASTHVAETNEEVAAISGQVSTALAPKLSDEQIEELNNFSLDQESIKT